MTVSRRRKWAVWLLIFLLGFTAGGYAMRDVQPRSFLAADRCNHCWSPSEIAGLVGAIVMQRAPGLVPLVVLETDRTIAIRLPTMSRAPEHFVIVPKRDIRDAAHVAQGDEPYLADAFAVIGQLVRDRGMRHYHVISAGPGEQSVAYLHFHLVGTQWRGEPNPRVTDPPLKDPR